MAFRYLIYSTGTTYTGTIIRESATDNPTSGEASLYSDFVIPEIQPLYLWQVSGGVSVIPNTDTKINNYETATAPAPAPNDVISYGEVTGITNTKIDKIYTVVGNFPIISASGNLTDSGLNVGDIIAMGSGVTKSEFVLYTGTTAPATFATKTAVQTYTGTTAPATFASKSAINTYTGTTAPAQFVDKGIYQTYTGTTAPATFASKSAINTYTGTTAPATFLSKAAFTTFSGTTLPANYYNKQQINQYTGATNTLIGTKVARVTGATTGNIVTFATSGEVQDSAKDFITVVNTVGVATNNHIPTELAVRNAINQAVSAAIILQGDWNATTNSPSLTGPLSGYTTGYAWRVSVSGTTALSGISPWRVGDLAIKGSTTWIRVESQDISAIWGNIAGTLSNQTDLQNALNAKANQASIATYTGTTAPNTYQTIALAATKAELSTYTGTTAPAQFVGKAAFNIYSGNTNTLIGTKLATSVFTGYTASTKNVDKKIQVVSTLTSNANTIAVTPITWSSSPVTSDMYLWSGGSAIWIKSAGTYEVSYHVLLKNDTANQTHSVGAYLIKNNATTLTNTATAGMVVGASASGELSLPPVVQTFALNDRLDLGVFRVGSSGNANLVANSVTLMLNKLS